MTNDLQQARDQAADAECGESPVRNSFFIKGFDCCYSLMAEKIEEMEAKFRKEEKLVNEFGDELTTLRKQVDGMREALFDIQDSHSRYNYTADELRLKAKDALEQHAKGKT